MSNRITPKLWKTFDYALCKTAGAAFHTVQFFNSFRPNATFTPQWSDKPLLKSWEKTKPTLGFPRQTDSLCPDCVKETRQAILDGRKDWRDLMNEKVGEIKAQIVERDGQIWMVKDCPLHGHYEDLMAVDANFLKWIEAQFPGRDIPAHNDEDIHKHGSSSVRYGRGSVLTVDLTNRCNMMCDPCFMDANQVGYVHELSWNDIKEILDNALKVKPRRQMSIQFSGGEPTLSPHFIDAVAYAKKLGYNSVQAATNGVEFAKSKEFCRKAFEAGLRYAYLQFDGIGNDANSHRQVGNLFDVKLRAIENMHEAGIEIVPVVTIVNGVNNDQVGAVVKFAMENPKKIAFVSFQPVSFTGRDEDVTPERRLKQRYTLSHLAKDVSQQLGKVEPVRDWFPISAVSTFSDFADLIHGPQAQWGTLSCGCHPNCGVGTALVINRETKEWAPVPRFLNVPGLMADLRKITDAARNRNTSVFSMILAILKNYNPFEAPPSLTLKDIYREFDMTLGISGASRARKLYGSVGADRTMEDVARRRSNPWNLLFVAGMWFQDLFNYDFRRTEMCIIPYATQQGEISFCAYNTGVGWRKIIENMHKNATVAQWYKEHGRHQIYAKGKNVDLESYEHSLKVDPVDAARVRPKMDDGVPKTASEEDRMRRRKAMEEAAKVRKIYEELVLKRPPEQLVQISRSPLAAGEKASSAGQAEGADSEQAEAVTVGASGD